ncbi:MULTISPECIES: peptidase domain-containing ABC transporter [Arenibacter]|jgi:ABC-type bacteriocin/lantibiotic exporter with double-glycine peptidase domain|uniref:Phosphate ABC transporter ATP-binding protein n=1 Tax=Arenibacter algicola TaxID=616991 RepID=A0A221UW88_9FLAO|nr:MULTISPECIES: ATP-binding cassette domain-containing protein [Arenibacter]ASO05627.1 phosphate ABC transporter ATP-binding protein [Arenibacter algicola]MDX1759479.1 ATP-binding cassette domain-containing protein [Arenibacter algicola]GBF20781.1 alpha-hemolysin translocation ATP-binding protein HlyB [Arenibacter sp. NBRC 103722]|tara:strand:- start:1936 stop:3603 length:1668 start_codon:yes stop_codon:yes gene_type:complete
MAKNVLTAWQRLLGLLKLDKRDVLQTFYYAIFAGLVNLSLPLGIQAIINLIQSAEISTSWVVLVVLVTGGVAFGGLLQLMQIRIIENVQQKIFTRASFEFTYRFPKIKMSELHNYYPPELANRFFDTLNVQKGLAKILLDFPAAVLQIVFGLILLSFYHPFFIVYGILLVLLIYVVFKFTAQKGMDTSLEESKRKYKVAHWIQEVARSLISFKLSGRTSLALDKNDALVLDYLEARESHFRILVIQFIQMIGFKVLVTAGLLLIGGLLVLNQEMNIGQFVAAEIIILLVISSVEKLTRSLETFYDLFTSLEKLGQVVDKELEEQQGERPLNEEDEFSLELDRVSFGASKIGRNILDDISLKIGPKTRLLVLGANGSGKSTLLRLIAGLIQPDDGNIYVNNVSLRGINPNHYRSFLGQSLTEEKPFEGTILENITFGDKSITEKEVQWAMENTGLLQYVKEQPKGINTMVYPEGQQMPFTVSKKIVLARSIVRKPKLLLLKDPLIQFDEVEAIKIIKFLTDDKNPWSLIVVSQDPKWLNRFQNIITLENGKIVSKI